MRLVVSLKSFASKLDRRKRQSSKQQIQQQQLQNEQAYTEPLDSRPPLIPIMLPRVHPKKHHSLSKQGWTTIDMKPLPSDPLYTSYLNLLQSSKEFFNLTSSQKEAYRTKLGSEDGWSKVEGEKEFITLRTLETTPKILRDAASRYWAEAGDLMNETLARVAESLGLEAEALTVYSEPCSRLGERTATMLRLFRYEGFEGKESKVVAEAHHDLGLLSLVIGDTPGLEVYDRHSKSSIPIEKTYTTPSQTILVGRQLERLSNNRYRSGGHLVRSYPNSETASQVSPQYRYSIVFVLRAHYPVPIDTDKLTTRITGTFETPIRGITALDMFKTIHGAHYNINTGQVEREEQKRKLAETNGVGNRMTVA